MRPSFPLLAALALVASCQDVLPPLSSTDAAVAPSDGAASVDDERRPLAYTPAGCMHTVSSLAGTINNVLGDRAVFGPMAEPADVHTSWPADPSSTVAFVWRTDSQTRATVVQYGTSPTALDQTAVGSVSTGGTGTAQVTIHETHVCGLMPDTTYHYRVGGEGHWSAVQRFKTGPAPGRSDYDVNFAVSGDSRDNLAVWRQVQDAVAGGAQPPDFEVFTGDAVLLGTLQGAWQQWFAGATSAQSAMPFVMVHGNHDALAINYLMQFAQPQAAAPEQSELYFSFDYGPVHFVFLNDTPLRGDYTGNVAGTQLTWMRADLGRARSNRARVPFIVAVHHKPCFGSSRHSSTTDTIFVRETWGPVFDEYGVDLVLNGHEHDFELSKELDGRGQEVSGRRGVRYIVAAGAGAELYELADGTARAWSAYYESVVNYLRVHATMTRLEVTPYRLDGTIIDRGRVTLTPRPL
ncbi:MAG: metallophosphoesterase [Myxococcaceae bacterium]|nr:metallophosphoesterase [Myxococcaceae bacterium]